LKLEYAEECDEISCVTTGELVLSALREDNAVMDTSNAWAAAFRRTRHIRDFIRWKDQDSYKQSLGGLLRYPKAGPLCANACYQQ
jgi:hypothetical protein